MDLIDILRSYIDRMLREVRGMKVLLLDAETTKIVSTVYSQSEILEHEVYLVQRLDTEVSEQLLHMKVRCRICRYTKLLFISNCGRYCPLPYHLSCRLLSTSLRLQ
jgi:hypothetical protein